MNIPDTRKIALVAGHAAAQAEAAAITLATRRLYRLRGSHPWLFAGIAFVLGAGLSGLVTMSAYRNWAFESIDLETALYHLIAASLGGGIVLVIFAFAYARTIRPALAPMSAAGITTPPA